jgi:nitroreductase
VLVITSDTKNTLANLDAVVHPGMPHEAREGFKKSVLGALGGLPEAEQEAWGNAQANIFLGFLLLAAKSLGYDTSPMLGFKPDEVKSVLGLPAHVRVPAMVALGKGAEAGFPHHRLDPKAFVNFR